MNIKSTLTRGLKYIYENYLGVKSTIFWIAAIINIDNERFWNFASAAIVFSGLQTIITILRNK